MKNKDKWDDRICSGKLKWQWPPQILAITTIGLLLLSIIPDRVYGLSAPVTKVSNDPSLETQVKSWMQSAGGLRFVENRGQLGDIQGNMLEGLLFKGSGSGVDMYITTQGLSYVFTQTAQSILPTIETSNQLLGHAVPNRENTRVKYCRADMELVGADIKKENVVKEEETDDGKDYYLPQCASGARNVHSYEKVTIKNIYSGIDWVLYSAHGKMEYDFVVHPGADPSQIRLRYKQTDKPLLEKEGSVKISIPMGDIHEGIPVSYAGDKKNAIATHYTVQGNEIGFKLDKYDPAMDLVIDPTLTWATYYGGTDIEEVMAISTDGTNVWVVGSSTSAGFPTVNQGGGSYFQGAFAGGLSDIVILQFNSFGKLIWATYYGGSGNDVANSISSDGNNVWVTGSTSSVDFPTQNLAGAYNQAALGSGRGNAFVLQFSCATNARIWATYYGGSGADEGSSIHSDGTDVWITGSTTSTNLPVQFIGGAGAYNQAVLGGNADAFILQFKCTTGARIWATYYGGNGSDNGSSINSDGVNVWLTGSTGSTDLPTQNLAGSYNQLALNGNLDAFILQFSCAASSRIWATYYGGNGIDNGSSINSDGVNVWLTGSTGSFDFPTKALTGAYNQSFLGSSSGNIFISEFSCSTSALMWATYYGGSGGDVGYSIQSDGANVWVCGATGSSDFPVMVPTCGYFQGTVAGGTQDVFILQFSCATSSRIWATYYGEDKENDGSFIASDGTNVFVTGDASVAGYPTIDQPGAFFKNTLTSTENFFIGKFTINCASGAGDVWPGDANENGIANNYDMLALGLGYGKTGATRAGATINWIGQTATDWSQTLPGFGTNDKYADCNGDGIIDFHDTTAIVQNYGLTHALRTRQPVYIAGLPDLAFAVPKDTVMAGATIQVPITLGSISNQVNDIYGIAFSIQYDPTIVDTSKISLSLNSSWLGANGTNLLYITKNFGSMGQLDVGITRIDHQNISGSGIIGSLGITMRDDILAFKITGPTYKTLMLSAQSVMAISNNDSIIQLNAVQDSVVVEQLPTGIKNLNANNAVKVYPNPASGSFTVELNASSVKELKLINIVGETIWQQTNNMLDKTTVDTQNLPAGTYYLSILSSQDKIVKQITIVR